VSDLYNDVLPSFESHGPSQDRPSHTIATTCLYKFRRYINYFIYILAFSALTLSVGWQEGPTFSKVKTSASKPLGEWAGYSLNYHVVPCPVKMLSIRMTGN